MAAMTLRGIDDNLARVLRERAAGEGLSINSFLLKILKGTLLPGQEKKAVLYDDLDHLAGTWTEEDAISFEKCTAAFEQVDESIFSDPTVDTGHNGEPSAGMGKDLPAGKVLQTTEAMPNAVR